jgi:hypothetical protein
MSHQMVGIVIHSLLTDEELRNRFIVDPMETIAALALRGLELTTDEIEVFLRTDAQMWSWGYQPFGDRAH